MKLVLKIFSLLLILTACADGERTDETLEFEMENPQAAFLTNLSSLCGEWFSGESTYPDNPDHPLVATELRTHISECDEDMVRIELYRDGDYWHGAWVLEMREEGLHLYHDHLGEVRTEEELGDDDYTGYGGYADERGSATFQFFPADDVTGEIIPEAATNVWMMDLDLENGVFVYYLERHDEPRFRAELTLDE